MKTIAAAAVFFALTATAWADEQESTTTADEPIMLSEAEMDAVTAGGITRHLDLTTIGDHPTTSGTTKPYFQWELQNTYVKSWNTGGS